MNKTIYIRDDDAAIWEKARQLAGEKLSPVIVDALKKFVAEKEAEPKGYQRIVVEFTDSQDNGLPKAKAFYGRWIYDRNKPYHANSEEDPYWHYFCVAETAKGNVVVHSYKTDNDGIWDQRFDVYPSFREAAADSNAHSAIWSALKKRGLPVEELDI